MGSPLGVLFAQAYMCHVENSVLSSINPSPKMYLRYVDDIFVDVDGDEQLENLKRALEENSCLRFTIEKSVENKIPFLDVWVDGSDGTFTTDVYRKPSDSGRCLNGMSECPSKYKKSVVRAYVARAFKICSSWSLLHQELNRIKQILTNNGFPLKDIDNEIKTKMDLVNTTALDESSKFNNINLYYQNTMSSGYKKDEKVLKEIIKKNCTPTKEGDKLNLIIYYRNPRTSSLIMKNNLAAQKDKLKQSNVVYKYTCNFNKDGALCTDEYIGYTTQTLSQRLTYHMQNGAIKSHMTKSHKNNISREHLNTNTIIIARNGNTTKLKCMEAVMIRNYMPLINIQQNMCGTLELYGSRVAGWKG
ncbi:uncharacterized protein LOC143022776 [Oratosquilla oratoria]|uniref:uncharacterized protein LOC143022776 n=1 Tax=Oratosquilla oratoria TaxID=337810 RepID=UPI003F75EC90